MNDSTISSRPVTATPKINSVPEDTVVVRMTPAKFSTLLGSPDITHLVEDTDLKIVTDRDVIHVIRNTETDEITYVSLKPNTNKVSVSINGEHDSNSDSLNLEGIIGGEFFIDDKVRIDALISGRYMKLEETEMYRAEGFTEVDYLFTKQWSMGAFVNYLFEPSEGIKHRVRTMGGPIYHIPLFPLGNLDASNELYISQWFGYEYNDPWFEATPGTTTSAPIATHLPISSSRIKYKQNFGFMRLKAMLQVVQDLMKDEELGVYNTEVMAYLELGVKIAQGHGFKLEATLSDTLSWAKKRASGDQLINTVTPGLKLTASF